MKRSNVLIVLFTYVCLIFSACGQQAEPAITAPPASSTAAVSVSENNVDVSIEHYELENGEYGWSSVYITVRNNSNFAIYNLSINVDSIDGNGDVIDTSFPSYYGVLEPGQGCKMEALFSEQPYSVRVTGGYTYDKADNLYSFRINQPRTYVLSRSQSSQDAHTQETLPKQTTSTSSDTKKDYKNYTPDPGLNIIDCDVIQDTNDNHTATGVESGTWTSYYEDIYEDALRFGVVYKDDTETATYCRLEYIDYQLSGRYETLMGSICLGKGSERDANVKFEVWLDGKEVWKDETIASRYIVSENNYDEGFIIDVTGVKVLRLQCMTDRDDYGYCIVTAELR